MPHVLQVMAHSGAARAQGRQNPEEQSAGSGCQDREHEHLDVEPWTKRTRQVPGDRVGEPFDAEARQQHSEDAAPHGEHDAFDEHLAHDAQSVCPERGPHRHLPGPGLPPRQEQVRYVGASDEEHESCCSQKHDQYRPRVSGIDFP